MCAPRMTLGMQLIITKYLEDPRLKYAISREILYFRPTAAIMASSLANVVSPLATRLQSCRSVTLPLPRRRCSSHRNTLSL